jgi:hypothetical protein
MLKKMLVVAAILLMAGTAFGGWATKFTDPVDANHPATYDRTVDWERNTDNSNITQRKGEVWNWPASYDFVDIGKINVRMEIGFWIRLDCKDKQNLTLKQRAIDQYGGSTTCKAYTNVATEWKASYSDNDEGKKLGGKRDVAVDPSTFDAKPNGQNLTIKCKIWEVSLKNMTPSKDCVNIGTITIKVRPTVRPNIFMSGCSGSYPVYAPPPTDSSITWW